ncbi:12213_t:CDS:2 [Funneliformis geosporum]|uniref:14166_t:CDS:1 n=1 Tax=Funneliformis geosporum TaxID=1117311 RepID=A0A9W4WYM3_9GLOM|nr:14166_t:CDS:2 [Funneliformis geosporum]CAI2182049.1 12213_t:CDS:2 [Funneliformis geosporum]
MKEIDDEKAKDNDNKNENERQVKEKGVTIEGIILRLDETNLFEENSE